MINERLALLQLNELGGVTTDNSQEFYRQLEEFASTAIAMYLSQDLKKFESHLKVISALYSEGNETVKNGIENVFLFKVLDTLDQHPSAKEMARQCLPDQLLQEANRQHYCSGL